MYRRSVCSVTRLQHVCSSGISTRPQRSISNTKDQQETTKEDADMTHRADGYGMMEDWRETGRAVRDRTTEIVKETAKAGRDAVKATTTTSDGDPAKHVPPESVNEYDSTTSMADIKDTVKKVGKRAMEKVKQVYERVEGMPNRQEPSEDMPSDSPSPFKHQNTGRGYGDEAEQEAGIKDETTRTAFKKGKQLQAEREPMNDSS